MKAKNPSAVTHARRQVESAILSVAKEIDVRVKAKDRIHLISHFGGTLAELDTLYNILYHHERRGDRNLPDEAIREIRKVIKKYGEKRQPSCRWLFPLQNMVYPKE